MAEPTTILRGLVGSTVHGLVLAGTDDRDEMGVCVEPRRTHLMDVRRGRSSLADILAECTELELRLSVLLESSPLPPEPDVERVETFVMDTYASAWVQQER